MPTHALARAALFAALLTLILVAWEQYGARSLRAEESARQNAMLQAAAKGIAGALEGEAIGGLDPTRFSALARDTAQAAGVRVTLIDTMGRVVGDSQIPTSRLASIENHAGREEVLEAAQSGVGIATRHSATVGRPLRYVAVAVPGGGTVRVSADTGAFDSRVDRARAHALGVVAVAAVASVALFHGFFHLVHRRPLRRVRRMAEGIADGQLGVRAPPTTDPDLARITRAVAGIAGQLRTRLREVVHEKEQLDAVVEGMVEGVLVVDGGGSVLLANSRVQELFGVDQQIVGRPLLEGIRNADLDALISEAARRQQSVARTLTLGGAELRTLQAVSAPLAREGSRSATVTVLHDLSEMVRLEAVRREFVANASHELRTPLTAIRGFAETLLGDAPLSEEERKSYLEVIHRHTQRLANVVEDLLEISTIESRRVKLEKVPVQIRAVAENLIADSSLRARELRIGVRLEAECDPVARADARALDQVLGNLLENALKYTDPGGEIEIRIEETPTRVQVTVNDSGIGIPPADLARIFERFYRVDKARSRALGGTGLGLSIVKHLLQAMDGDIHVESRPGEGSSFVFSLPREEGGGLSSPA